VNENKSDYCRGVLFFCIVMGCVILFFNAPDGQPLLYKFIGLFGLNPGISLGYGTLYIYGLVPIIAIVLSIKKILQYWHGYGTRFSGYNILLRFLPIIIAGAVFLLYNVLAWLAN